jgi:hypothetical protein
MDKAEGSLRSVLVQDLARLMIGSQVILSNKSNRKRFPMHFTAISIRKELKKESSY